MAHINNTPLMRYERQEARRYKKELKETRTAMIPAIMTGTTDLIIRSGRRTDMAAMPTPDFAVP
jgi:hypothetical protein